MSKIYIASSWKNTQSVRNLACSLREQGHIVFDFTDMGYRPPGLDKFVFDAKEWAEHSGKNANEVEYKDFLTWEPTQRAFKSDKAGIDWADVVILLIPSGRSSHLEAGYTVGAGKELYIFGDLPIGEFDAMYGFAKQCFLSTEKAELFQALRQEGCT